MDSLRSARLTRADLAVALEEAARADLSVARVLTACEAWEAGYITTLMARAEELCANGDQPGSPSERALTAIDSAIRHDNPFLRVHRSGVQPSDEAVDAMLSMLHEQTLFHEASADLERRAMRRVAPPAQP
jgi:hypothetical protein